MYIIGNFVNHSIPFKHALFTYMHKDIIYIIHRIVSKSRYQDFHISLK